MPQLFFILQVVFYLLGAGVGFLFSKRGSTARYLIHFLAIVGSGTGIVYSLGVLISGRSFTFQTLPLLPMGIASFECDLLSAFFVFVISFLSFACSIYALGYTQEYEHKRSVAFLGFFYNIFLLSMILVVMVRHAFYFLVFWELMSLASYFLVIYEHEKPEARKAGFLYFVMTHIGTAFIMFAFLLLFVNSGSFSFDVFHLKAASLSPVWKNLVFIFALIGFGTKAGMIPLHIWLPEAHPQAPSHVSALMSGVMIKTAIYALLRVIFGFLGNIPSWWGSLILSLGILSVLLGILYALMEHDLKKLLAFSSIENIGVIFLGMGMALVFVSAKNGSLASFALIAALYHVLNHAAFKGLLFLGAGSVLSRTHTRNMEQLGGLIKKMPFTAGSFLIGSLAISALPPFNGFVSEWMTFLSLLSGIQSDKIGMRFFAPVLAAILGLAGALVAMCFVKAMGVTFLGMPRSSEASNAQEVPLSMKVGKAILSSSCLLFALLAPWLVRLLGHVAKEVLSLELEFPSLRPLGLLTDPLELGRFSPWLVFLGFFVVLIGLIFVVRFSLGKATFRIGPSWDCGTPGLLPRMQYSATGYSKPIRRIFSFLYQPTRRVEIEDEGHEILRTAKRFESRIHPLFEEILYRPVLKLILTLSRKVRRIQTGHIQLYLSYIFVTLILLLVYVRMSR